MISSITKFLLITQPRSGSAWLMSSLHSHPQIFCPRQPTLFSKHNISPFKSFKPYFLQFDSVISPYYKYRTASFKLRYLHIFFKKKLIYSFLSEIYSPRQNVSAIGYKINYSQISRYKFIIPWVRDNKVKLIHLVRNNLLKRFVSHKIANSRKLCHTKTPLAPIKIIIDPSVLLDDFRRRQKRFIEYRKRFVEIFNCPFIEVAYENLLKDFEKETKSVLNFLKVDPSVRLMSEYVKVNPDSAKDIIANYDDIKNVLTGTEFENFLL